jgi:hypothetical protein
MNVSILSTSPVDPAQPPPQARKTGLHGLLLSRGAGVVGIAAVALSVALPLEGFGVDMCWFYSTFQLPCPGCGLTRSVTHIAHLDWTAAWRYNPFGFAAYGFFLIMALAGILPTPALTRLREATRRYANTLHWITMLILSGLLAFGALRLVLYLLAGKQFPEPL